MFRSLRVRNYRLYATGQVISLTGTWMQRIAQDWLVLDLTDNNGTALGLVIALQFAPTALLGLWGGVLADRYDKRRLLVLAQLAIGMQALVLGLLDVSGTVALWHVFALAVILGTTTAVEAPARQSFAMELVGRDDLPNAVALNSSLFNFARLGGPAMAGLMINWAGTGPVFFVNAASVIAVITALALMEPTELYRGVPLPRARGQLREGMRYVRSRVDLFVPMVLISVIGTFGMNFQLTMALMAREVFHRGAGSFGLLTTMLGLGALCGALLSARRRTRPGLGFLVVAAMSLGLLVATVGLMPTYVTFGLALVPAGVAIMTYTTAGNTGVQMDTDPAMRGRVMALYLLCFLGGAPIGAPMLGVVAEQFGPRVSIVMGGLTVATTAAVIGILLARRGVGDVGATVRLPRPRASTGSVPHASVSR